MSSPRMSYICTVELKQRRGSGGITRNEEIGNEVMYNLYLSMPILHDGII